MEKSSSREHFSVKTCRNEIVDSLQHTPKLRYQEFITPYTPEQNGIVERFFRSLKKECVWQHNFARLARPVLPSGLMSGSERW